jgi:glycine/D-amino acid oxidase-like deaminating enzyme
VSVSRSIVIVGAGVFGLTAAWELAARGWRVTVSDPGPLPRPAAASTDISKVVRADYGTDELYTAMAEAALAGWDLWNARWPEPLYHPSGFLLLSPELLQRGRFEYDSLALLEQRGHRVERLRGDTRGRRFPAWAPDQYPDGYFNPRAGWVESAKVVVRLAVEAKAVGVRLLERTACDHLLEQDGRVVGIQVGRHFAPGLCLLRGSRRGQRTRPVTARIGGHCCARLTVEREGLDAGQAWSLQHRTTYRVARDDAQHCVTAQAIPRPLPSDAVDIPFPVVGIVASAEGDAQWRATISLRVTGLMIVMPPR